MALNFDSAKSVSILFFLEMLGKHPARQAGEDYWYHSPRRAGQDLVTPSFKVNAILNKWHDFGDGQVGDVIDLAQEMLGKSLTDAVLELEKINAYGHQHSTYAPTVVTSQATAANAKQSKIILREVKQLTNTVLINYLRERGINMELISKNLQTLSYLQEARYKHIGKDNEYFSIAWRNDERGYELRSRMYQGSTTPKTITHIKGYKPGIMVFEGFMDYLSALTYYRVPSFGYDVLVLNSLSFADRSIGILIDCPKIILALDNDTAGYKAKDLIIANCSDSEFYDIATEVYKGYKDFNDFILNIPINKQLEPSYKDMSSNAKYSLWCVFNQMNGPKNVHRTFYSFNNDKSGLEGLLNLRKKYDAQGVLVKSRLNERIVANKWKVLEQYDHTPKS